MSQRVLVTGSSGAIGTAVTAALLRGGHEVVALSRSPRETSRAGGLRAENVVGDISDESLLRGLIADVNVVCHLAAFIPPRYDDASFARACFDTNSLATLQLASAACEMKKRFIYGSTGSLYQPGPLPAPETSPTYPAARAPYYLGSKLLGELYVEHLRLTQGLDSVAFRIGAAYGASVTRSIVKRFVSDALAGQPLPVVHGGMVRSDFTYVEDLASLFLSAVRGKQSGVFNAGSGMATSILQIAEAVCEVFAEFKPVIHHVQDSSERPPDFAVLCMEKTNAAFAHAPVAFGAGLRRMKDELLARG